ncbi:MAG: aldehyde dehydrogenase family protein [bacterium]
MRNPVLKTYKLVIGGQAPRTESGRYLEVRHEGQLLANICRASRKDAREAVVAARKAQAGWASKTAYNRGQILYRIAEVLEQRSAEFLYELVAMGATAEEAEREVAASVDRLIWYAGWPDKFPALVGTVNPVAAPYFNFTFPEPTGVVVVIAPDSPALLGVVSLIAPVIATGNSCVLIASETSPLSAVTWGEVLATSDLPGGVVNILTGLRRELVPPLAQHKDVNAVVWAGPRDDLATATERDGATNIKRVVVREPLTESEWYGAAAENPVWMEATVEMKTVWHPIGQ